MNVKEMSRDPSSILDQLLELRGKVYAEGLERFRGWYPGISRLFFVPSALNLAFYLALRQRDLRDLQSVLKPLGLSTMGRSEAGAIINLDAVIASLACIAQRQNEVEIRHPRPERFYKGEWSLDRQTKLILGPKPPERKGRIMVTLSAECAVNYSLVRQLLVSGMNVARINCAHDDRGIWQAMIDNVRQAEKKLGQPCKVLMELAGAKIRIDEVALSGKMDRVGAQSRIFLTKGDLRTVLNDTEQPVTAAISCTCPEAVDGLRVGDQVHIDDGKITGIVEAVLPDRVRLKIVATAKQKLVKLKSGKGIYFKSRALNLPVITPKDQQDLDFIVTVADALGFSWVRSADDISMLQEELTLRLGDKMCRLPLVVKIETADAIVHLPEIIVRAASRQPIALMIARGDLAMEVGYERLAELQEEILWISEAAHVPVIWATQVLESLVKYGTPSRAEMTDAAMSERAECVMLNKGPFIVEAVELLDRVLMRMEAHQQKKTPQLGALSIAGTKVEVPQ